MDKHYEIRRLDQNEIPLVLTWASQEGWNPGLHDAVCFYKTDPQGFFCGQINGEIIAVASAVNYDDHFSFFGLFIVNPIFRGQGYGLALTHHTLSYVGQRNSGLDGVLNMQDKYAVLGYKFAHINSRYKGVQFPSLTQENPAVVPLTQVNIDSLLQYDRKHFPASRTPFLQCWIKQPDSKSIGYIHDGQLSGYGVIRRCQQGFRIGPLFADNAMIANELFLSLANFAEGQPVNIDIPENNPQAVELVNRYSLDKVFETARMYLKGQPAISIEQTFGITSFELG